LRFLSKPPGCLTALGMVAQDDSTSPAVGFCVSKCPMKHRTVLSFAMELGTGHERKRWLKRKSICSAQPGLFIGKGRALPRTGGIIVQDSHQRGLIAHEDLNRSFHRAAGDFLTRTRLGKRSSSNSSPTSSR